MTLLTTAIQSLTALGFVVAALVFLARPRIAQSFLSPFSHPTLGTFHFRRNGHPSKLKGPPDPQRLAALCASYELDMDMGSVPGLFHRFGI